VRRAIARANAPPAANPFPKHFDQIAGYTFMGMVATAAGAIWIGIADRREAGGLEVRAGAAEVGVTERALAGVGAPAPAIAPLGRGVVVPRAGAADAGEVAGAASRAGAPEGASALDSVRLRDGTVRTGVVERLSPEGIVLRDPWSNRAAPLAFDDVVELRTRRGEVLPVGPAPADSAGAGRDGAADRGADSAGAPALHAAGIDVPAAGAGAGTLGHSARVAGLAGRYVVRRRVLAVSGSESCSAVAAAVGAAAPTVETVAHRPGEGEFALTSRPGLRGTVDDDGRFRTGAVAGSRGGVHYQFRMVGQFLPDGFRAETESETRAVLRWGEVQSCRVSVALDAARVP
jgi:hypothetical protein